MRNKHKEIIELTMDDVNALLYGDQLKFFYIIIEENVFCGHCLDVCKDGITVNEILLDNLDDIVVQGTCNTCGSPVARHIETGEDKIFVERARIFRQSRGI